ncbi:hypothetical protein [Armatimonas sp.]|uniref:hypothetical protein n=1 Tax=Armatimonas sp. TaxID=1872638 RepID=UPI00286BEC29|nr:hypothetical protein [Armatimonas sp.]
MNPTRRSILRWGGLALATSPLMGLLMLSISGPSLLEKQREAARREGIPLTSDDLRPNPPIPDSENAGPLLKELTERYNMLPKRERSLWEKATGDLLTKPSDANAMVAFDEGLTRYADLIVLLEQAAELPHCDLAYDWNQGPLLLFPEFAIVRNFARVLMLRARTARDAKAAWADIARTAKLGNLIGETPCSIAALVYVATHSIADRGYIETLKRFGPSVQAHDTLVAFGSPPEPEHYFGGELVLNTMAMKLLHDGKLNNADDNNENDFMGSSWRSFSFVAPVAAPIWEKQILIFWRQAFPKIREVQRTGCYEELGKWLNQMGKSWELDRINVPQNLMVLILFPMFSSAPIRTHLHTAALRRLRESALALSEEKAKMGSFPDSPTLPADPFSKTGEPLRYKKEGAGCVLYSVGQDHTDDGGVEKREKNSEKLDLVVRL